MAQRRCAGRPGGWRRLSDEPVELREMVSGTQRSHFRLRHWRLRPGKPRLQVYLRLSAQRHQPGKYLYHLGRDGNDDDHYWRADDDRCAGTAADAKRAGHDARLYAGRIDAPAAVLDAGVDVSYRLHERPVHYWCGQGYWRKPGALNQPDGGQCGNGDCYCQPQRTSGAGRALG